MNLSFCLILGIFQKIGGSTVNGHETELDFRTKQFHSHVIELCKMKEAIELWLDSFDTYCAATAVLGNAFREFYEPCKSLNHPSKDISMTFHCISTDLNTTVRPPVREVMIHRCLEPVIAILALVPGVEDLFTERKKILSDVEIYRARLHKELATGKDFTNLVVEKLTIKLDELNKLLTEADTKLSTELEKFELARPTMLVQELSTTLASLYHYHTSSSYLYGKMIPILPQSASTLSILHVTHVPVENFNSSQLMNSINDRINAMELPPFIPEYSRGLEFGGSIGGYGEIPKSPLDATDRKFKNSMTFSSTNESFEINEHHYNNKMDIQESDTLMTSLSNQNDNEIDIEIKSPSRKCDDVTDENIRNIPSILGLSFVSENEIDEISNTSQLQTSLDSIERDNVQNLSLTDEADIDISFVSDYENDVENKVDNNMENNNVTILPKQNINIDINNSDIISNVDTYTDTSADKSSDIL